MLSELLQRSIVFVGGKGGVGKTSVAAAIGLAAARANRQVLLVSTDPAHSLGDIFEKSIGDRETELLPRLSALEIDPERAAARYVDSVAASLRTLVHPELYPEIARQMDLARSAPGAVEAALVERIAELTAHLKERRGQLLVFDTAPTGHTLRLLALPEMMSAWTEGMLRSRDRTEALGKLLARLGQSADSEEDLGLIGESNQGMRERNDRIRKLLSDRRDRFQRLRENLRDPQQTAYVLVVTPEKLPILETRKAYAVLRDHHIPVAGMVLNRLMPALPDTDFLTARRSQESVYVREIEAEFSDLAITRLPLLAGDVRGMARLAEVAAQLFPDI